MTLEELSKTAGELGYQLVKFGGYIDCAKTVEAAARNRQSLCEYVEQLWGSQGSTRKVIDEMRKAGCFRDVDSVCEIGPGTGRYLDSVLHQGKVSRYAIYETAQDWAQWLQSRYPVVRRQADGETLKYEADRSCHLVHAHGVFTYLKYIHCFKYFKEMIRICRPGGYIVFDFFPDELFDVSMIQTYLSKGENYPVVLSADKVNKFFRDQGAELVSQFTHQYGHGYSLYHVYQMPAHAPRNQPERPENPGRSVNRGSEDSPGRIGLPDQISVGRRKPFQIDVSNYETAIATVNQELQAGRLFYALDLCEQIVEAHPGKAVAFLAAVYDLLKAQPNFRSRYLYQSRAFDFAIQPGWKVLDVGSGNDPFPLATHLADLSVSDDRVGRAGAPFKQLQGRPVYECNIEKMPFADKEFDFVFCSHVLEHVGDPEKACRELMRIGKRGYIETPTRGKDLFFDYARVSNHKWAVERIGERLVFMEYDPRQIEGLSCNILNHFLEDPRTDREKAFSALMFLKADRINTMLLWHDQFEFEVRRLHSVPSSASFECGSPSCDSTAPSGSCLACRGTSADRTGSIPSNTAADFDPQYATISAVIPAYNRAAFLPRTVQSILSQTHPVSEIVIVDDVSTDNTEQLVRQMQSQCDRIRYIRLPQKGGAQRARNTGIQAAAGEWIAFLDSDDVWLPDRIRLCLEKARQMQVPAVYTEAYKRVNGQLTLMKRCSAQGFIFPEMLKSPGPMFQGLLVRKECLLRVGLLDESLPAWQEWDAFLRLSQFYKFGFVAEPCFVWDAHESDTISKDKSRDLAGYERIVETWKDQILKVAGPEALENHRQSIARKRAALISATPVSSKMTEMQAGGIIGAGTVA